MAPVEISPNTDRRHDRDSGSWPQHLGQPEAPRDHSEPAHSPRRALELKDWLVAGLGTGAVAGFVASIVGWINPRIAYAQGAFLGIAIFSVAIMGLLYLMSSSSPRDLLRESASPTDEQSPLSGGSAAGRRAHSAHLTSSPHQSIDGAVHELPFKTPDGERSNAADLISRWAIEARSRLVAQTMIQQRRATLGLLGGLSIGLVGAVALGWVIIGEHGRTYDSMSDAVGHLAPRGSLVLVVEALAFFCLRIHQDAFREIRYYTNEITNIQLQVAGSLAALEVAPADKAAEAMLGLARTERNFRIGKDETTTDVELLKTEAVVTRRLNAALESALGAIAGARGNGSSPRG